MNKENEKKINSAFPRRSLIMTEDGLKDIYNIKEGNYVFTNKDRFAKVLSKDEHISTLIEIRGHGHPELKTIKNQNIWATNYENIWDNENKNTTRRFNDRKWLRAENMKGMFWSSPIDFIPVDIPIEFNKELAWFIGAYLYDSFIMYDGTIYFKTNDFKFEELEKRLNKLNFYFRKKEGSFIEFFIKDKEFSDWLKNAFNLGYGIKNMPFWIYGMDKEYRKNLFEGFLWNKGVFEDEKCRVSTRDKYLAIGMKLIAQTLGYSTALYVSKHKKNKKIIERWQIVAETNARSSAVFDKSRLGLVRKVKEDKRKNIVYSLEIENNESYLVDGIFVK